MQDWNSIMYPLEYGMGMMRFKLAAIMTRGISLELISHAGSSGTFAFYHTERDVFIAGTVNQMSKRDISFKLMTKVLSRL